MFSARSTSCLSSASALSRTLLSRSFSSTSCTNLAKMTIVGHLGASPEAVTTSDGTEVVRYSVATRFGPKDSQTTSWWKVASMRPSDGLKQTLLDLPKGTLVYVEGEASMRKFERDGKTENALSLYQQKIEILKRGEVAKEEEQQSSKEGDVSTFR